MPRIVFITGFMGSGKTTVGKKLASLKNWRFIDLDEEIENKEGKSIGRIFSENGEKYFRKIEAEILRGLSPEVDTVISVGGGTPCFYNNMDYMLEQGIVIYLKLSPDEIKSRIEKDDTERPLLKGIEEKDMIDFIERKLKEREEYYNKAHIITSGYNVDVKKINEEIKNL
ncbi:MAG TPA: shikimate kinase [Bacteroidales bacterium]|nr:shikimate kinase [Bacteroidales bacterium]HCI55800.1 shikimate kinase [Bacteroidales bacterium]HOU96376.1 shikimate kinase [Bacteroidales bacterium]HQG37170.1 shikimate kinase [Bacteroidales bacterium]HQG52730.1 shikimate kinase [Bacteroidales bacterium]